VVGLGLIVAYAAAMLADPGERSLYHPPAAMFHTVRLSI
jgi:hypothetical protein